MEEREIVKFVT